jgi:hypothetical protein
MDTTLVTVTLLSMGMAASLSVIVWRMLRVERERSEARIVALTTMAARPSNTAPRASNPASRTSTPAPRASHLAPRASHLEPRASRLEPLDLELEIREAPVSANVSATPMFAEREVNSPWGRRVAVMAGLGLVLASVILFALTADGKKPAGTSFAAADPASQPGPNAVVAGLELLSLRDTRQPGSLTITGLVQNPRGGAPLSRVTVTAYAFDDKGAFLASGRALLDVTTLSPGDESPFVVSVPVTETVARYRIGFRSEDGRVISHVDKRQQAAVAAHW